MPDSGVSYRYTNSSGPSSCGNDGGGGGDGCGYCSSGTFGSLPSGDPPGPDGMDAADYLGGTPVILVGAPIAIFCPGVHGVP